MASILSTAPVDKSEGWFALVRRHAPAGQFGRYLLVGIWNTACGYGLYASIIAVLSPTGIRYSEVWASFLANGLSITVAFLGYKWFVFRTKGNYLREWSRCVMVYSTAILIQLILIHPITLAVAWATGANSSSLSAKLIAGALLLVVNVLFSFFGHKKISFRQS
jgi:putative flippase GtrA